jgi:hypothetical protein
MINMTPAQKLWRRLPRAEQRKIQRLVATRSRRDRVLRRRVEKTIAELGRLNLQLRRWQERFLIQNGMSQELKAFRRQWENHSVPRKRHPTR